MYILCLENIHTHTHTYTYTHAEWLQQLDTATRPSITAEAPAGVQVHNNEVQPFEIEPTLCPDLRRMDTQFSQRPLCSSRRLHGDVKVTSYIPPLLIVPPVDRRQPNDVKMTEHKPVQLLPGSQPQRDDMEVMECSHLDLLPPSQPLLGDLQVTDISPSTSPRGTFIPVRPSAGWTCTGSQQYTDVYARTRVHGVMHGVGGYGTRFATRAKVAQGLSHSHGGLLTMPGQAAMASLPILTPQVDDDCLSIEYLQRL